MLIIAQQYNFFGVKSLCSLFAAPAIQSRGMGKNNFFMDSPQTWQIKCIGQACQVEVDVLWWEREDMKIQKNCAYWLLDMLIL